MDCNANMPGDAATATFSLFYHMFMRESLRRDDVNDVIYDAEGAREG